MPARCTPQERAAGLPTSAPIAQTRTEFVEAGGPTSYGAQLTDNFKTLATFVDRLLRTRPRELIVF